ncbi:MAG: DUF389 domain-containing protein [Methanobacteriaceae archaeon]|nr:DUF389 domain-containing protein [Methanobacteriaceae archaeon]
METYIPIPDKLEDAKTSNTNEESEHDEERIFREELYTKVIDMSKLSSVYVSMDILSSFVAAIGVLNDDVAVIFKGMIIAPLIGPNIGISFSMVMGDLSLARTASKSSFVGYNDYYYSILRFRYFFECGFYYSIYYS